MRVLRSQFSGIPLLRTIARAWVCAAFVAASLLGIPACVTTNPRARDVPPQPSDASPSAVQLFAASPRDTNGNGYVDSVAVTVFVFDQQRSVVPIAVPGSFTFRMTRPDGTVLAEWTFDEEQTHRVLQPMPPGPGYLFDLSLLGKSKDALEYQSVDLTGEFQVKGGKPVRSAGGAALRLGKISL